MLHHFPSSLKHGGSRSGIGILIGIIEEEVSSLDPSDQSYILYRDTSSDTEREKVIIIWAGIYMTHEQKTFVWLWSWQGAKENHYGLRK